MAKLSRKFFFLTISFIFLTFIFLISFLAWREIHLPKDSGLTEEKLFLAERGQNVFQIAENLEKEGLIKNKFLFNFYVFLNGAQEKLQAGKYLLSPAMDTAGIAKKIVSGDIAKEKLTIIEGWNLRDIGWYFDEKGMFMAEELFEFFTGYPLVDYLEATEMPRPKDFSQEFDFLKDKPKNLGLEGYLFPDTYEIKRGEGLEEIVRKILRNFDKKLIPELREEIKRQEKTIFEIITMASLIEKEVRTKEDKELVSGILWKRLRVGMPLQVDATIIYITGKRTTRISIAETKIDSPYNTYKYRGLPIGPICNPGLKSILAALHPKESDYWYYLSKPTGETVFSRTFEEHKTAKAKYLR